jgi:hypothetical protein
LFDLAQTVFEATLEARASAALLESQASTIFANTGHFLDCGGQGEKKQITLVTRSHSRPNGITEGHDLVQHLPRECTLVMKCGEFWYQTLDVEITPTQYTRGKAAETLNVIAHPLTFRLGYKMEKGVSFYSYNRPE